MLMRNRGILSFENELKIEIHYYYLIMSCLFSKLESIEEKYHWVLLIATMTQNCDG